MKLVMKKLLLFILIVVSTSGVVFAQKGSWYIGGGFSSTVSEDLFTSSRVWRILPDVGTWLSDDFQFGIVLSYTNSANLFPSLVEPRKWITPHLYVRKWKPISDKFSLYAGANAGLLLNIDSANRSHFGFEVFVDLGMAYSFTDRWTMVGRVGSLGYQETDDGNRIDQPKTVFFDINLSPGSMFNLGLYYTFTK